MTANPGGKKHTLVKKAGAWLYGLTQKAGWKRWVLLTLAAVAFIVIVAVVCDGVDYREDPSALVPRSAHVYAETGQLDALMKNTSVWAVWTGPMRKAEGDDRWTPAQRELAGMIGSRVSGLGTRLPLMWLSGAQRAAIAIAEGEQKDSESWAIYLQIPDPAGALAEMRVEPGLTLEPVKAAGAEGVHELSDGKGKLYFGVIMPWFIISSDAKLPQFAADSLKKPGFSLGSSDVLPGWRRDTSVRGMFNPAYSASQADPASIFPVVAGWMSPDSRVAFTARVGKDDDVDVRFAGRLLSGQAGGGGMWPFFKFLLGIVGLVLLFVILAIVSVMIGWGGWLKALALRAGIAPKPEPAATKPSEAFKEDAGIQDAADPLLPVVEAEATPVATAATSSVSGIEEDDKAAGKDTEDSDSSDTNTSKEN